MIHNDEITSQGVEFDDDHWTEVQERAEFDPNEGSEEIQRESGDETTILGDEDKVFEQLDQ